MSHETAFTLFADHLCTSNLGNRAMRRLVIALDQDNFYVGVARILDPTLRDLPIGITQKSLFATVSYEARALGLRKLQSIRSAREEITALGGTVVKQGQHGRRKDREGVELVLVDGEDLSAYRRASAAVAWIVEGIVGAGSRKGGKRKRGEAEPTTPTFPGPEKLGMDEVFIDVTSLIDAHLASKPSTNVKGETYFELPKSAERVLRVPDVVQGETLNCGFWYGREVVGKVVPTRDDGAGIPSRNDDSEENRPSTSIVGTDNGSDHSPRTLDSGSSTMSDTPNILSQRLVAATHLCAFLRQIILRKTGLSSSGGVAGCKMLAKLMVSENKPAGQAVWVGNERNIDEDPRWNGGSIEHAQNANLPSEDHHDYLQAYLDPIPARNIQGFGSAVLATLATAYATLPENPTMRDLRTTASQAAFRRLLPSSQATVLWDLLLGCDEAPVKPSPQFPAQISVEDSSAANLWRTFAAIRNQAVTSLTKLIERMEEELMIPPGEPYEDGITFQPRLIRADSHWVRYPSQLRLTIRTYTSTQSKSASMPAFVFDSSINREERAERIMKSMVERMIKSLLGKGRAGTEELEYEIYVLNIAATDLRTSAPPPSISAHQPPQIDMDVLASLPNSIRAEMMQRYGISDNALGKGEVIELSDDDEPNIDSQPRSPELQVGPSELTKGWPDNHSSGNQKHVKPQVIVTATESRIAAVNETSSHMQSHQNGVERDSDEIETPVDHESETDVEAEGPCERCGNYVFRFAALAHARWHEQMDADSMRADLVQ